MALNFGKVNRSAAFNPTSAFPLDARYYFETLIEAQEAAYGAVEVGSSNGTFFYGENLVVVENGKATLYLIQPDNTLTEVGSVPVGDGQSIEIANGKVKLNGFGDHYYAYSVSADDESVYTKTEGFKEGLEPRVVKRTADDGSVVTDDSGNPIYEIAWYEPSTTTVEGLNSAVDTLSKEVANKADKTTTLAGYGITDAYTNIEVDGRVAGLSISYDSDSRTIALYDGNTVLGTRIDASDFIKDGMLSGVELNEEDDLVFTFNTDAGTEAITVPLDKFAVDLTAYKVKDADTTEFVIDENGELHILEISGTKVVYETKDIEGVSTTKSLAEILAEYDTVIDENTSNIAFIEEQIATLIGEDAGKSIRAIAEEVSEENAIIKSVDDTEFVIDENGELQIVKVDMSKVVRVTDESEETLAEILENFESRKIEKIYLGDNSEVNAIIASDGALTMPYGTTTRGGLVKSSAAENSIAIGDDGYAEVVSLNVNKLVQTDGDVLILRGGSATS